ncbi:MAG: UDP-N-acetylmuramoyl-tripeptide--D-alanyl-D-alanine ligase [Candidatus Binataceae bacterium]
MATPIPRNLCSFTLREIAGMTGGELRGDPDQIVRNVSIDSRSLQPGALFIALRGATHDGHDHLRTAAERGAAACLVERGRAASSIVSIEVGDTLRALGELAQFHLERVRALSGMRVIAIGGSAGKTTTKEITAALARAVFGATLATPGNLNNLVGVPMTLFTLTPEHRAAVIECGTNQRGEISRLASILKPDAALVLNADIEHSEGLGTIEEIADEETALFRNAPVAVAPAGEPLVTSRIPSATRVVTFGASAADVTFSRMSSGKGTVSFELDPALVEAGAEPRLDCRLKLVGAAAAVNAAAALAAVAAAGETPLRRDQLEGIRLALESVEAVEGRLRARVMAGIFVLDDTYNANPRSVRVAIESAREVAESRGSRLVMALGDMLELGALSQEMHLRVIREVALARPAIFVAVGPAMMAACESARRGAGDFPGVLFSAPDSGAASSIILGMLKPGDVFLVKGSRGMRMERLIEALET